MPLCMQYGIPYVLGRSSSACTHPFISRSFSSILHPFHLLWTFYHLVWALGLCTYATFLVWIHPICPGSFLSVLSLSLLPGLFPYPFFPGHDPLGLGPLSWSGAFPYPVSPGHIPLHLGLLLALSEPTQALLSAFRANVFARLATFANFGYRAQASASQL